MTGEDEAERGDPEGVGRDRGRQAGRQLERKAVHGVLENRRGERHEYQ